jgi:hypothetical protein
MKCRVFCDVLPCSQVDVGRRFRGAYCITALMMAEIRTSETSVNIHLTTLQYIPEDTKLHTRRCENLKSLVFKIVNMQFYSR